MRYKHFKNANVDVSQFAVGTWGIGEMERYGFVPKGASTKEFTAARNNAIESIQAAIDGGVNLIDTAPCYGNGRSEIIVGEAIRDFKREDILIATKFSLVPNAARPANRGGRDAGYKNIMREVATSLSLLGTDYIDFYFVHWPDLNTDIAETMSALNVLKKRGLIRYIGLSNHSIEQIKAAQEWGQVDVIQPPYSMLDRGAEELMKWSYENGIDSLTYGSLGSGLLTGAIRKQSDIISGGIQSGFYGKLYKDETFAKFQELLALMDKIGAEHNKPVAQVAINWSTQQEFVGTALCGVANAAQAKENCATFDWALTDEEMALLNAKLAELDLG